MFESNKSKVESNLLQLLYGCQRVLVEFEVTGQYCFAILLQSGLTVFAITCPVEQLFAATPGILRPVPARIHHAEQNPTKLLAGSEFEDGACLDLRVLSPLTFRAKFMSSRRFVYNDAASQPRWACPERATNEGRSSVTRFGDAPRGRF